ncbi:hypothetical protein BUALT_Bualt18G0107900 [Buddleja alternifolia]|uniref:Nucleolar protein 12 n=1 Tax=Buddleja alternifolia TaxID=168488 RepID=A0AAV6WEY2_9LAMI|nr:hypothetical protein BUALT_Bualt18G0107900 [Buddleja alternifolia]
MKKTSSTYIKNVCRDYVTGFHKRKKKRRKEAMQQQEEAERRKRIEQRKKRKLDRDFVQFGGAPPDSGTDGAESDEEHEHDEDTKPIPSVSGIISWSSMTMYDNGDMQVTVTTSEIAREEDYPIVGAEGERPQPVETSEKSKQKIPVIRKKLINRAPKKRSRPKPQSKRDKRKGKKKSDKRN